MHDLIRQVVDRWRAYDYDDQECAQGLREPRLFEPLLETGKITMTDLDEAVAELRGQR